MNKYIYTVVAIAMLAVSYVSNYVDHRDKLHDRINSEFKKEAPTWCDSIMIMRKYFYSDSGYSTEDFPKNKNLYLETEEGKIVISPKFYNPDNFLKYNHDIIATGLLICDKSEFEYDFSTTDSLFKNMLMRLGVNADVSTTIYAKSLFDMFINEDSMNVNAPYVRKYQTKQIEGFTTDSVLFGICGHGKIIGTVNIPMDEIVKGMDLFTMWQFITIVVVSLLYLMLIYVPGKLRYMQNVEIIGNSCVDFNANVIYYWNGDCYPLTKMKADLLRLLADSKPEYKLLKDELCRKMWNRDSKDGQALYNVAMSELRNYLVAKDDSLNLKTIPKEGVVLLVDDKRKRKYPLLHFIGRINR